MVGAAVVAERRLGDPPSLDLHRARAVANVALKERHPQLRNYAARADHHSADRDQLVNVLRVQVPHARHLFNAERTHLKRQVRQSVTVLVPNLQVNYRDISGVREPFFIGGAGSSPSFLSPHFVFRPKSDEATK